MPNLEETSYSLDRWLNKWSFILRTDKELLTVGALIALRQLDDIVSLEFERLAEHNQIFYHHREKNKKMCPR